MHLKSHILDLTNQLKTIFGCFIYYFLEDEVSRFLIHWTPLCWISTEFLSRSVQTYHFQVPYSIFSSSHGILSINMKLILQYP